jgi:hypothetical protein
MELAPSDIIKIVKTAMLFAQWESPPEADKPMAPQLLRYKGFAVKYYSFTLYVSDLKHPRLLQR